MGVCVPMRVCAYECVCVCVCGCVCACVFVGVSVSMCLCVCAVRVCVHVRMGVWLRVQVRVHVYACTYANGCVWEGFWRGMRVHVYVCALGPCMKARMFSNCPSPVQIATPILHFACLP